MIEEILQKEKGDILISRIKRCDRCLGGWLEKHRQLNPHKKRSPSKHKNLI